MPRLPSPATRDADLEAVPVINDQRVIGSFQRRTALGCRNAGDRLGVVPVASPVRRGVFACRTDDTLGHAHAVMDRLEVDLLAVLDAAGRVVGVLGRDGDD